MDNPNKLPSEFHTVVMGTGIVESLVAAYDFRLSSSRIFLFLSSLAHYLDVGKQCYIWTKMNSMEAPQQVILPMISWTSLKKIPAMVCNIVNNSYSFIYLLAEQLKTEPLDNMIQALKECQPFANIEFSSFGGQDRVDAALSRQVFKRENFKQNPEF